MLARSIEEDDDFMVTPQKMFTHAGTISRSSYRRSWHGSDFRINYGKFKSQLISEVRSAKWLTWALNKWAGQMDHPLNRALIDQYNSLFL